MRDRVSLLSITQEAYLVRKKLVRSWRLGPRYDIFGSIFIVDLYPVR